MNRLLCEDEFLRCRDAVFAAQQRRRNSATPFDREGHP